jgi:hypothetical protein
MRQWGFYIEHLDKDQKNIEIVEFGFRTKGRNCGLLTRHFARRMLGGWEKGN